MSELRWPTAGHRAIGEAAADAVIQKVFPDHRGALDTVRGVIAKVMRQHVEIEAWEAQLRYAKANAWDEGYRAGHPEDPCSLHPATNPYREVLG